MDKPLVSIIIPIYNAAAHLEECINSAINQTWQNKQIILVDDGSTDQSLKIVKRFESDHVKILAQKNKGAAAARNLGMNAATGQYIQFLDADDILSLDKIENQVKLANTRQDKLIVCNTIHFFDGQNHLNHSSNPFDESYLLSTNDPIEFLLNLWGANNGLIGMVQPNAWLTPRSLLEKTGNWNETVSLDDDGEFFCRVLLNSKGVIKDNVSRNYYRKYKLSKSVSGGMSTEALKSQLVALTSKRDHLFQQEDGLKAKTAVANLYLSLAMISFRKNREVYTIANKELKKIGIKPNLRIIIGGPAIQIIKTIFGWRFAKLISIWKRNLAKEV